MFTVIMMRNYGVEEVVERGYKFNHIIYKEKKNDSSHNNNNNKLNMVKAMSWNNYCN